MNAPQQTVALAAIAKNEAAYIHEWIHHHLYFGFGPILIGINRTTDTTTEIIEKISRRNPSVQAYNIDWIDAARPHGHRINQIFQPTAYAYFWDRVKRELPDCRFLAFFDADEFWFPANFKDQVPDFLRTLPEFDIVSFYWACQFGDKETFTQPFTDTSMRMRGQLKTIINLRTEKALRRMRAHTPLLEGGKQVIHLDANGVPFRPLMGQKAKSAPTGPLNAALLHRMTRSETEYLARLKRARPGHDVPIKNNREGFWYTPDILPFTLPPEELAAYHASLEQFIIDCDIEEDLQAARAAIHKRAEAILDVPRKSLIEHLQYFVQALKGTRLEKDLRKTVEGFKPFSKVEVRQINSQLDAITEVDASFATFVSCMLED